MTFSSDGLPTGSPFKCEVVDSSKVAISGEGLEKVPIGRRATFIIEPEGRLGQPEVKILGPTKKTVHSSIQIPSENKFLVEYVPVDVGKLDYLMSFYYFIAICQLFCDYELR